MGNMTDFTDEEIETIKALILDHGCDYPSTDWDKIQALGEKLGCLDPVPVPTPEQLERDRLFSESPEGKMMAEMFSRCAVYAANDLLERKADFDFTRDVAWGIKQLNRYKFDMKE